MLKISNVVGGILLILAGVFFSISWYALVPAFTVLGLAIITRKALEPLIVGCSVGFMMIGKYGLHEVSDGLFPGIKNLDMAPAREVAFPLNLLQGLEDTISRSLHDGGLIWVILVCILYGALVQLLVASGGVSAIADFSSKFVNNKKQSLIMTYFLAFFFFIDDYLSALSVGNTMRPITDKFKVSREKLAMVLSFVCVPITIIMPVSTWTIFYGTNLMDVESVSATSTSAISAFANTIPYNFSAIISLVIGFLVVFKLFPDLAGIKAAENKANQLSDNYAAENETGEKDKNTLYPNRNLDEEEIEEELSAKKGNILYFIVPIFMLIFFTVFAYPTEWGADYVITDNIDALRGVATTVVLTYLGYLVLGVMKFDDLSSNFVKGLETITFVLVVLGFTYLLKDVQGALGFDDFVTQKLQNVPGLNGSTFPVIVFTVVSFICWATGSNWGIYAILVPATALLSQSLGSNFWLTQGALASGTVWGAAACFFSDNRVLTAQSCKVDMMQHGTTQFPYQIIILIASMAMYLLAGFIL
ncbi:Na+/H+ antiporter NhaC family protein [Nubsella zeaxanthinifaciens]|uniref:Na+/H+ antiporter NhaC family protein n=1 Tax=Nubsella zeaxanthinifaciens TaxID=392412 RepID=UPI0013001D6A|nr:Na+/H+ antiporter NhaC family protein [Nubsella zeaxanthinifaciens]